MQQRAFVYLLRRNVVLQKKGACRWILMRSGEESLSMRRAAFLFIFYFYQRRFISLSLFRLLFAQGACCTLGLVWVLFTCKASSRLVIIIIKEVGCSLRYYSWDVLPFIAGEIFFFFDKFVGGTKKFFQRGIGNLNWKNRIFKLKCKLVCAASILRTVRKKNWKIRLEGKILSCVIEQDAKFWWRFDVGWNYSVHGCVTNVWSAFVSLIMIDRFFFLLTNIIVNSIIRTWKLENEWLNNAWTWKKQGFELMLV